MTNPVITLFQKEVRQNAFIYLFPLLIIGAAFAFQKVLSQLLSPSWAKNFAVSIPVALAFSYALQAFDLEENYQTRDFLLTKPLTVSQIVGTKYFTGLFVLLCLTVLWQSALIPDLLHWPDLNDFGSLWFTIYLLFVIIVYSLSFTMGAWVKGPKKLLAAIGASFLGTVWFFCGCLELLTVFYLAPVNGGTPILGILLMISLIPLLILIKLLLLMTNDIFLNHSGSEIFSRSKCYLPLLLFPLLFYLINLYSKPEIRPFNSLFACLNGTEEFFQTVEIVKQPEGDLYAATDIRGRLGLVKPGEAPQVIYEGEKTTANLLSNLGWSPDGAKIAFNENGVIKVFSLTSQNLLEITEGELAFWSLDSDVLLVAAAEPAAAKEAVPGFPFRNYRLSYISSSTKERYELQGNLSFPGSSMFWHPSLNTIIAVTHFWEIAIMNLNTGVVEMLKIPPLSRPGPVFLTEIAPNGADSYRIAVFTDLRVNNISKNNYRYNLALYDFSLSDKQARLKAELKNLAYQDILINAGESQIWGGNFSGAYRKINLP